MRDHEIPERTALGISLQKRISALEQALKELRRVKKSLERRSDSIGWLHCVREDADQHRSRVLSGSIGLEGSWEEWKWGVPSKCAGNRQYEYRRQNTPEDLAAAAEKAFKDVAKDATERD